MKINHWNSLLLFIGLACVTVACQSNAKVQNEQKIVCTTTIVADLINNIAPPTLSIMGPGTDPHLYKSKSGDHQLMNEAEIIAHSGLHLEGKLSDALDHLAKRKNVICLSDGIADSLLIQTTEFGSVHDPHFWFDVDLVKLGITNASEKLIQFRPNESDIIKSNTSSYLKQLDSAALSWEEQIKSLPVDKRVLITAHDAFSYFGRKYQFTVKGIQGASTAAEAGLKDITNLVDYIVANQVKAIFVESSVSERNVKAIIEGCQQKGHILKIGGTLYSDALGSKDGPAGSYMTYMHTNISTIVNALQ